MPDLHDEQDQIEAALEATGLAASGGVDMPCVATREGDRVIVRSWVMSRRRLIHRLITVQPDGHYLREDAVIAENLPIR